MPLIRFIDAGNFPVIFTILELITMAFTVMGTPIQQFNVRGDWLGKKPCYTLWGFKSDCGSTAYDAIGGAAWGCDRRTQHMTAAALFAVASAVLTVALVLLGLLMVCSRFRQDLLLGLTTATASFTLLLAWACVASVYSSYMCGGSHYSGSKFSKTTEYAVGFMVLVVAWCLQCINCTFTFLFIYVWNP